MSDPAVVRRQIAGLQLRPRSPAPPPGLERRVEIEVATSQAGWRVYRLRPLSRGGRLAFPRKRLLGVYFHGGAYIHEINLWHWRLASGFVRSTGAEIAVPIYPLAPAGTAADVVPAAAEVVGACVEEEGPERAVLLGDSAGGGMAMAALGWLRDRSRAVPRDTILISPWLDLSLSDPGVERLAWRDPMLGSSGLRVAGAAYRADLDEDDPRVSPLRGDLSQLGRLTVFTSTRDLLNSDARRLRDRVAKGVFGTHLAFYEAEEMLHDYPLFPIREGREARRVIVDILRG